MGTIESVLDTAAVLAGEQAGLRAGIFLRVSTGDQHEENQLPECLRYCDQKGYIVARTYTARGKSAYKKGELDAAWREVVDDVKAGLIQVVVLWKVTRLDRQNLMHPVPMVNMVLDAADKAGRNLGARIEFVTQPMDLTTSQGRIAFAMYCEQAYTESKDKSDNVKIAKASIRRNGKFDGRIPYGYRVVGTVKYEKHLEPDIPGTGEVMRDIVKWYLEGDTLAAIANRLDGMRIQVPNHKKPSGKGWSPATLHNLLTGESLIGKRRNADGQITHTFTPILAHPEDPSKPDMDTWRKLQALIKLNGKKRGSAVRPKGPLQDIAYCGKCKRVIHYRRIPDYKYPKYVWTGYRCDGTAKSPSTCKVMVNAKDLESWVDAWFTETGPFAGIEIVETLPAYDDRRDRIDEIDQQIENYPKRPATAYLAFVTKKIAERETVENEPRKQGEDEHPTGIKVGKYWLTLTAEEKREYLLDSGVKVYVDKIDGQMEPWITGDPHKVLGTIKRKNA
jgi:DNA invertase Pin-like site-specific DNA recombinase